MSNPTGELIPGSDPWNQLGGSPVRDSTMRDPPNRAHETIPGPQFQENIGKCLMIGMRLMISMRLMMGNSTLSQLG
jgi:hypothetical protein